MLYFWKKDLMLSGCKSISPRVHSVLFDLNVFCEPKSKQFVYPSVLAALLDEKFRV